MLATNAHKRYYKASQQTDGSKLKKYRQIIFPFIEGKGMLMDVDDRLKLVIASQVAGHTGHVNEVNSIIEELRELKITA